MNIVSYTQDSFSLVLTKAILVIACFLSSFSTSGQENSILAHKELLSVEEGLASRTILEFYEDSDGFLWFGTTLGLSRYDGTSFQTYDEGMVSAIFEDKNKQLWLISRNVKNGAEDCMRIASPLLRRLNIATKSVVELNDNSEEFPFLLKDITDINQDGKYNLWFTTALGKVFKYNGDTYELIYDNNGIAKVGGAYSFTADEIIFFENRHLVTFNFKTREKKSTPFEEGIEEVFVDNHGRAWFLTARNFELGASGHQSSYYDKDKIYYKDQGKPLIKYHFQDDEPNSNKPYQSLWFDHVSKDGKIWRMRGNKVESFDRNGKFMESFVFSDGLRKKDYISVRFLKNTTGNIFWTNEINGLHKFTLRKNFIKNILNGAIGKTVSTRGLLKIDEEHLLVSNYFHGLIKYNLNNASIERISNPKYPKYKNLTYGTAIDEYGRIWLGTGGNHIQEYSPSLNKCEVIYGADTSYNLNVQFQIPFWDSLENRLWIGSIRTGLYYLDENSESCQIFDKYNGFDELKNARVNCFLQKGKEIWIGTSNGIFVFDFDNGVRKQFKELLSKNIIGIAEDEQGLIWLGTSDGLLKWNPITDKQKLYSKKNQFSDNYIYSVHIDEFGYLWLPSNVGLMRFNPETEHVNVLLKSDGLTEVEFNFSSKLVDKDGLLYLGTINGINIINPRDFINEEKEKFKVMVTDYKVAMKEGEMVSQFGDFYKTKEMQFLPDYKSIQVDFALQDYSITGEQKYAYKIGGHYESWIYIDENYIRINKLPFGKFDLIIKGVGGKGVWSDPIHIPLNVLKPFYLKTPFILSCVGLLLLSIYYFVRMRLTVLKKRQLKLEGLVKERTEELSEKNKELEEANQFKDKVYSIIAHDLRGPAFGLQGVGLKLNYLIKTKQFGELQNFGGTVEESIANLNALLDNLLKWANQNMKSININKEPLELNDLINHSLAEQKTNWSSKNLIIENKVCNSASLFADKQTMLTILRNLIANAIKFTPEKGQITISSEIKEDKTIVSVKDNGIGISEERLAHIFDMKRNLSTLGTNGEKGTGLGLGVCKELALLNSAELKVKSSEGKGTTFYIVLPTHSQAILA